MKLSERLPALQRASSLNGISPSGDIGINSQGGRMKRTCAFAHLISAALIVLVPIATVRAYAVDLSFPVINSADADANTLYVDGLNFGVAKVPKVTLGGIGLTVTAYTPTTIAAVVPTGTQPATYLLLVTTYKSASDLIGLPSVLNVTIGDTGPKGPKGDTGPIGPQGVVGPQGPKGDTGATGAVGGFGPQGPKGDKGDRGDVGLQGAKGDTGPPGLKGDTGTTGAQGPQGITGPKGDTGATGPQGPQGIQGNPGTAGQGFTFLGDWSGSVSYMLDDVVSHQGSSYVSMGNGNTGQVPGVSTNWSVLAAGGAPGPKGDIGAQGPKGDAGTPGLPGPPGAQGPQGVKGDTGAQGPAGPQGIQGPIGPQGPPGTSGTAAGSFVDLTTNQVIAGEKTFTGDIRTTGMTRAGSETGTTNPPLLYFGGSYSGLITRRINSLSGAAGNVIATSYLLTLERDGTNGGLRVTRNSNQTNATEAVDCIASLGDGRVVAAHLAFNNAAAGSSQTLFTDAQDVRYLQCAVGDSFNGGHQSIVVLQRWPGDNYWVGTLTSTLNQ